MDFDLTWMAWTWNTAAFFIFIAFLLITMSLWEWLQPGGSPRHGILQFETTRGDRLFITLLGTAYIHLGWLAFAGGPLWWATLISVLFAVAIFAMV